MRGEHLESGISNQVLSNDDIDRLFFSIGYHAETG